MSKKIGLKIPEKKKKKSQPIVVKERLKKKGKRSGK
jgi:hypothetical protein